MSEALAPIRFRDARHQHWEGLARTGPAGGAWSGYYHQRLEEIYRFLVPAGLKVLELGCGRGDLLAALRPSVGVGVDFSGEMLKIARQRHPELRFVEADVHELDLNETFDVIVLSDLLGDLWDVLTVLRRLQRWCGPETRIILNAYSRLWQAPLALAKRMGLAQPTLDQSWLAVEDIANLLYLADFEVIRKFSDCAWPVRTPGVARFFNRYLAKLWPFRHLSLANFLVARPASGISRRETEPVVSVVVPARNEAGNMATILDRIPEMGAGTEVIFVEGHSKDDTYGAIEKAIAERPKRRAKLFRQTGKGKGDAVRLGFAESSGDILMILDADMTVPPEDLPRFYEALRDGHGEFINGVRLVYPMESQAMRFANLVANKFFGLAFSWLLGQSIKDTLCGTKVLWRQDYERIVANRKYFGDFDPFGDFDLIFGAAKSNLRIVDMPVRYRDRTYGTTNIQRWRHGVILLRMVIFAARRIKFV